MSSDPDGPDRSVQLITITFLGTAAFGSLMMMLVCALAPFAVQVAVLGVWISILAGLTLSYTSRADRRRREQDEIVRQLAVPDRVLADSELYRQYLALCRYLTELLRIQDPILRDAATRKLASVAAQVAEVAGGRMVFAGTEAWPAAYAALLTSPELHEYRAVAWVRSKDYGQDERSRGPMRLNLAVVHGRMLIERTIILRDELWPSGELLPSAEILPWIQEQHDHGLWIALARESELVGHPDLLMDIGIFGDRAVSTHERDEQGRLLRFALDFDPQSVAQARNRWDRLAQFATPFRSLLERLPDNE